jgi:hypothetical protein
MSRAPSVDLRIHALATAGTCLANGKAGQRLGVGSAGVIRWHKFKCERCDLKAKMPVGDRRSGRIEAHCILILAVLDETTDITLNKRRRQ